MYVQDERRSIRKAEAEAQLRKDIERDIIADTQLLDELRTRCERLRGDAERMARFEEFLAQCVCRVAL